MLIHRSLQHMRGNYRALLGIFNLPAHDYERFQAFLTQHKCNLPFRNYRTGEMFTMPPQAKQQYRSRVVALQRIQNFSPMHDKNPPIRRILWPPID
jgi:hypothetical protein